MKEHRGYDYQDVVVLMAYLWGTNGVAAFWYVLRPLLGQVGLTPVVQGVILFFPVAIYTPGDKL